MNYEEFRAHVPIDKSAYRRLELYHETLLKWQRRVNLIAPGTVDAIWERHILDSAQLLRHLPRRESASPEGRASHESAQRRAMASSAEQAGRNQITLLDIGSGAGFPGMVLAICGAAAVTLIESDRKKAEFLKQVARLTKTPAVVLNRRAEEVREGEFDVIVSRAVAGLDKLLNWAAPLMDRNAICLFHKGRNCDTEIKAAGEHWAFDLEILPSESSATGCIIKITNLSKRAQ